MIRQVSVGHSKYGYVLIIRDVKTWRVAVEGFTSLMCLLSRGYLCPLCLCAKWQWTFKIGWGRDDDGLLDHSLGGLLFHLGQFNSLAGAREVYERPLSFEEVCEHFPESRMGWDNDGTDYVRGVMTTQ